MEKRRLLRRALLAFLYLSSAFLFAAWPLSIFIHARAEVELLQIWNRSVATHFDVDFSKGEVSAFQTWNEAPGKPRTASLSSVLSIPKARLEWWRWAKPTTFGLCMPRYQIAKKKFRNTYGYGKSCCGGTLDCNETNEPSDSIPEDPGESYSVFCVLFGSIPTWPCALPAIIVASLAIRNRIKSRFPAGHCPGCGYNLTGNTSGICPECGSRISIVEQSGKSEETALC